MDNQKDIFKALIQAVKSNDVDTKPAKQLNEAAAANISLTGDSAAEVEQLMRMFKNAGMPDAAPAPMSIQSGEEESCGSGSEEDPESISIAMGDMEDEHENGEYDSQSNEEYENEPNDEYQDNEYMQHDLAGGINKPKKMYAKAQDGDNAMAVETIKQSLLKALSEKMQDDKVAEASKPSWEKEGSWSKNIKKKQDEYLPKSSKKPVAKEKNTTEASKETKFSGYSKGNNKKGHPDQGKLVGESKEVNDIVKLALTEVNAPSANKTQHALDLKKLAGI